MQFIHGFGFLSENYKFAKICEETNLIFIGPSYKAIDLVGNKINAKEIMKKAGVPLIPGSDGRINTLEQAIFTAEEIGYPIILKAVLRWGRKRN